MQIPKTAKVISSGEYQYESSQSAMKSEPTGFSSNDSNEQGQKQLFRNPKRNCRRAWTQIRMVHQELIRMQTNNFQKITGARKCCDKIAANACPDLVSDW